MKNTSLHFYTYLDNLNRVVKDSNLLDYEKNKAVFSLFNVILEDITDEYEVHFTTLFSRLAFLISQQNVNKNHSFFLHRYRTLNEKGFDRSFAKEVLELGIVLVKSIVDLQNGNNDFQFSSTLPIFQSNKRKDIDFISVMKVLIFDINQDEKIIYGYDDLNAHEQILIKYDVSDKNEIFTDDIESAVKVFSLPLLINLLDVSIDEENIHTPLGFVIDPDFLIDVTRVADTFANRKIEGNLTLTKKLFEVDTYKKPLLIGNISNMIFDEVLHNPEITFDEMIPKIYNLSPMAFAMYDDKGVIDLIKDVRSHFFNLKKVVSNQLDKVEISRDKVYLEPSFYSSHYGLQGRLDLLHDDDTFDIVELKSGSPFMPNKYGLSEPHYVQTLLYDLMIHSAFGDKKIRRNYILYSKEKDHTLRYAPSIKAKQIEAMHARNRLVLLDYYLTLGPKEVFNILKSFTTDRYSHIKGFAKKNIEKLETIINGLNSIEKVYISEFFSFIAREQRLAKVGEHGLYKDNGLAALWLEVDDEKEARFSLLKKMEFISINDAYVTLKKTDATARLADFRQGDIAVFYPFVETASAVLKNQIFKCSIVEIDDKVIIKLRNTQYNKKIFESFKYWNIEADMMDSAFNVSYRSLMTFAQLPKAKRDLLMGLRKPRVSFKVYEYDHSLSNEQNHLVQNVINADDYFLLWGPPGTGKTSMMIRKIAHHMAVNETKPFLLLAYTNKAVDEICEAISDLDFIRIGSEHSCGSKHRYRLLSHISKEFTTRKQIISLLESNNIYVGTVSSILGKPELFKLKNFGTVIIDEASQLLEPLMLGVLSRVDRFVLIGDHKQLPAVVKQDESKSMITYKGLNEIGIHNMKTSFYERLLKQNEHNGWDESLGVLTHQGRMHESLMDFINRKNYNSILKVFPKSERLVAPYFLSPMFKLSDRKIYIDTKVDNDVNWKTNEYEALKVTMVINELYQQYKLEDKDFHSNSIGVIAPYRAHIALIDKHIKAMCPDIYHSITIDTVERYQGGARDIIIISLCTNNDRQFETLVSLSAEGIDRKLNVALTRAKEQIIILGNREVINSNETYAELVQGYHEVSI